MFDLNAPDNPIMDAARDGPVGLSHDEVLLSEKLLSNGIKQLEVLRCRILDGRLMKSDVHAHLSLIRRLFDETAKVLRYGDYLDNELKSTEAMLRDANARIRSLMDQLGGEVTGAAVTGALNRFLEMFRAWYSITGFHYATIQLNESGIVADFSERIDFPDATDPDALPSRARNVPEASLIKASTGFAFAEGWDIEDEGLHGSLLDTDRNRRNVRELFGRTFPGCFVHSFTSTSDRNLYVLEFKAAIRYEQIYDWYLGLSGSDASGMDHPRKEETHDEKNS